MRYFLYGLAIASLAASAPLLAKDSADRQLVEDCRLEGKAAGMTGSALDTYVKECIEDFAETEINTNIELPTKGGQRDSGSVAPPSGG